MSGGFDTQHAVAVLVLGALVLLFVMRKFFASVNVSVKG